MELKCLRMHHTSRNSHNSDSAHFLPHGTQVELYLPFIGETRNF